MQASLRPLLLRNKILFARFYRHVLCPGGVGPRSPTPPLLDLTVWQPHTLLSAKLEICDITAMNYNFS